MDEPRSNVAFKFDVWRYMKVEKPPNVPGQGPIPRADADSKRKANPTAEPITSSKTDFASLVGGDIDRPRQAGAYTRSLLSST